MHLCLSLDVPYWGPAAVSRSESCLPPMVSKGHLNPLPSSSSPGVGTTKHSRICINCRIPPTSALLRISHDVSSQSSNPSYRLVIPTVGTPLSTQISGYITFFSTMSTKSSVSLTGNMHSLLRLTSLPRGPTCMRDSIIRRRR